MLDFNLIDLIDLFLSAMYHILMLWLKYKNENKQTDGETTKHNTQVD